MGKNKTKHFIKTLFFRFIFIFFLKIIFFLDLFYFFFLEKKQQHHFFKIFTDISRGLGFFSKTVFFLKKKLFFTSNPANR